MGPERASVNYTRAGDATNVRERANSCSSSQGSSCGMCWGRVLECAPSFGHKGRAQPDPQCRPCAHATHAHPARRHRGSRNMQARRASGARSACHGWSAAGLARICALSSRSSRHQPSDPHKATLQACCRAACDAFDAPSIAAPPSAAPSLFELEPTRAASSRTTCGPLNPGGCSPVARGVRWRPPIRLHRMSDEVTRRTMR